MTHYDALSVVGWVSALAWSLLLSVLVLEEIHIIGPRPLRLLVVRPWWPVRVWRVIASYTSAWRCALRERLRARRTLPRRTHARRCSCHLCRGSQ